MENDLAKLYELLKNSSKILVFTGAGISTGSGIPDFRGPKGVWKRRQPVYYHDFMNSEQARIEYWDYKLEGWEHFRNAKPNKAHKCLADLEKAGKLQCIVTQNIDGLHSAAGNSDQYIIEVHGSNRRVECQSCHKFSDPAPHFEYFRDSGKPPTCSCGGFWKPATISFGQSLKDEDLKSAATHAGNADMVLVLGSTLSVYPASEIPLSAASRGIPYIIINQGTTDHDQLTTVTLRLEGDVQEILPPIVDKALAL